MDIYSLKKEIESYAPDLGSRDDVFSLIVCKLALAAVEQNNYGVGSVLVDSSYNVVISGQNTVFYPYFRSDRHAEMVVINAFEDNHKSLSSLQGYTLYTSLEPCPMCLTRLIGAGCRSVIYVTEDQEGGMASRVKQLPPIWVELANECVFRRADCSTRLKDLAWQIFRLNSAELNAKLLARSKLQE